jgi:hypothetical protein
VLIDGFVTDEFIGLARAEGRDADQDRRHDLKQQLADRVMAAPADAIYGLEARA